MHATEAQKQDALSFLREQTVATLATVSPASKPHAATIYYVVNDDFTFFFFTKSATSKYENVMANPQVALVVTNSSAMQTVQVEGRAMEIAGEANIDETYKRILLLAARNSPWTPPANQIQNGVNKIIKIEPVWLRWGNFSQSEPPKSKRIFIQIIP